jgi:hypothetical protein
MMKDFERPNCLITRLVFPQNMTSFFLRRVVVNVSNKRVAWASSTESSKKTGTAIEQSPHSPQSRFKQ